MNSLSMLGGLEEKLGKILSSFPIDADSTDRVDLRGLRDDTRLYKISLDSPLLPETHGVEALYILDTPSGEAVACHPHLVGGPLEKLSLEGAHEFRAAVEGLGLFESGLTPDRVVLYGFTAIPALVKVGAVCSEYGAGVHSFSICDLTQLASNNYDMPRYRFYGVRIMK